MMRLFELVTPQEWETAKARSHKHADIDQALLYLVEHPEERVRVKAPENGKTEKKRHTLFVYAQRRGMIIETIVPGDGWIYAKLRPATETPKSGPHASKVLRTTADEFREARLRREAKHA